MVSLATETDRTLFFDFLPLDLGTVRGFKTRFHLYTVPGQVFYEASRKLILKGADGVVFVADSQEERLDANFETMENLQEHLKEHNLNFATIPYVYAKLASAADSDSKVGMASTRRVTVRASRTRPWPQTRRSMPPSRASLMEMRTSVEMPELSICGMPFRRTTTFFAPPLTTDSRASWSCSAGSPMVSRPRTSSTDTPPDSRTLISMGNLSVISVRQTILIGLRGPFARPQGIIRWRVSRIKGTVPEDYRRLLQNQGSDASEKQIQEIEISNSAVGRACV